MRATTGGLEIIRGSAGADRRYGRRDRLAVAVTFYSAKITGDLTQSVPYLLPGDTPHALQVLAVSVFFAGLVAVYALSRRLGADSPATMRALSSMQAGVMLAFCVDGPIASGAVSDLTVGDSGAPAFSNSSVSLPHV